MTRAQIIRVRGVVQGVGFRPFVFRLARLHALSGWVSNGSDGVEVHVEGPEEALEEFVRDLEARPPVAARIVALDVRQADPLNARGFSIRESEHGARPTTRISPDLPVCDDCLSELLDPEDRRHGYPYVNCTACGPRYSIVSALPYDRAQTTMREWTLCATCAAEYEDVGDRRFHAQPVACPACGPHYVFRAGALSLHDDRLAVDQAIEWLNDGCIVAIKGIGGYHLACDASNASAVGALRDRKYRKDKPFAIMVRDLDVARRSVALTADAEQLLTSSARPIVLARARIALQGVAPDSADLGVMLPYTPLHHLLFARGGPPRLVMTSGNRSSEPIAYRDDDALERLDGIADAFLIGERPIARRIDDSIVRAGVQGPTILRRSRGYAPGAVATLPAARPILALGADLKNTITIVVDGEAYTSQHIGDLEHHDAIEAHREAIRDLSAMYEVSPDDLLVAHDGHPEYVSTQVASALPARNRIAIQHHRAHIASVLAERGEFARRVLGVAFDGTGYGDDGSIWGGEFFVGSVREGFVRAAHLRPTRLAGGDAAARFPVQAAAGFLEGFEALPNMSAAPFVFPRRYASARMLLQRGVRYFPTTSAGRLFDAAAALTGFTRPVTYEAQAAMWLEQQAQSGRTETSFPFEFDGHVLDWRPALRALIDARLAGMDAPSVARAFHDGFARGIACAVDALTRAYAVDAVVLSGGVFQNETLLSRLTDLLRGKRFVLWTNAAVPANDGGISLGQAAIAAMCRV